MAPHVVSLGGTGHYISPVPSRRASIVSVGSILSDTHEIVSLGVPEAPHAAESWAKGAMSYLMVEPSGGKTPGGSYPGADDSFLRHDKYFFNDGNITFLVDGTLYCVHRYFFSRDSGYFATRFAQLGIRDHEPLPTIISLGDIECRDFEAFLSVIYPENFEQHNLSYEEWKSVLHLSTRWGFGSLRKLALASIKPPTPHDQLLLARRYSVDYWVVPALSALCERTVPLSLYEARQMRIEDVVLVATVRENIRNHTLRVDVAEIPHHVEAALAGRPSPSDGVKVPPANSRNGAAEQEPSSTMSSTASPNVAGTVDAKPIVVAPPADLGQAARTVDDTGENDDKQLEETAGEVGTRRGKQPHVTRDVMQNAPVNLAIPPVGSWTQWWIEAAARRKAEAKRKAEEEAMREAGAEAMYDPEYEAMLKAEEEEAMCEAEEEARRRAEAIAKPQVWIPTSAWGGQADEPGWGARSKSKKSK